MANLILRSRAVRGVSKDGAQSWCCPPFETRPEFTPRYSRGALLRVVVAAVAAVVAVMA
jgi:hypothetical protein